MQVAYNYSLDRGLVKKKSPPRQRYSRERWVSGMFHNRDQKVSCVLTVYNFVYNCAGKTNRRAWNKKKNGSRNGWSWWNNQSKKRRKISKINIWTKVNFKLNDVFVDQSPGYPCTIKALVYAQTINEWRKLKRSVVLLQVALSEPALTLSLSPTFSTFAFFWQYTGFKIQYMKPKHVITRIFHIFLREKSLIVYIHSLMLLRFVIIIKAKGR